MRNILVIVGRELRAYFVSPIAYAIITIFTLLSGLLFTNYLGQIMQMSMMRAMQGAQMGGQVPPLDVPGIVLRGFLNTMSVVLLFMTPMLTMALFSEEKRRGTMELLLTSPITDAQIVLGKFFGAVSFIVILLATTWVPVSVLYIFGQPASGPILTAYLGILLYGIAVVAIGMFISTLTENQIVAAVITFVVSLMLWLMESFIQSMDDSAVKSVLSYLSIGGHLDDFMKGIVITSNLIFYLSLTLFGLFLTYRSIDSLRWRG